MADRYDKQLDLYSDRSPALLMRDPNSPGRRAYVVTPDDNYDVTAMDGTETYYKRLWVGEAGNLSVIAAGDDSFNGLGAPVVFENVPVGFFDLQVRRVLATGTTAGKIRGLTD